MAALQPSRSGLRDRSILPTVPGVHTGIAVAIAAAFTLLGAMIDAARGTDLTGVFAAMYVIGCVLAVLAVRGSALFTAAVQPPLLLFIVVPCAYQLMTNGGGTSLKDLALNDAVPLINKFPVMAGTTVAVGVLAGIRVLIARSRSRPAPVRVRNAPGRGSPARGRKPVAAGTRSKSDTVKDKLDRITAKANELKAESSGSRRGTTSASAGRSTGSSRRTTTPEQPIRAGYPERNRSSRGNRRDPTPPPYDPGADRRAAPGRGHPQRSDMPSHPAPGVRYRDRNPYDR